jgi:hypothetical protein
VYGLLIVHGTMNELTKPRVIGYLFLCDRVFPVISNCFLSRNVQLLRKIKAFEAVKKLCGNSGKIMKANKSIFRVNFRIF